MTTAAQVKKAVKPLLDRHPDLAISDRWIIVKPVRHIVRGLIIDRTRDRDVFNPRWCVMHLFDVRRTIFLNWGFEIYQPQKKGLWLWSNSTSVPTLLGVIEEDVLPKLRAIQTISDLVARLPEIWRYIGDTRDPPLSFWPDTKVIFDVALGDLDAARKPCADRIPNIDPETYFKGDEEDHATVRRLKELCARLAADDRNGLAALLHDWEATTVKNLKLEHLWEPTPFPLELLDSGG
jgi:hypothetical protein